MQTFPWHVQQTLRIVDLTRVTVRPVNVAIDVALQLSPLSDRI